MSTFLPAWAQVIFVVNSLLFFSIALLFYRSKDGRLRQVLIIFFAVLGSVSALRCVERYMGPFLEPATMAILAGIPVTIITGIMVRFLYRTYR